MMPVAQEKCTSMSINMTTHVFNIDIYVHLRLASRLDICNPEPRRMSNDPLLQPYQLKHLDTAQPHHRDVPRAGLSGRRHAEGAVSRLYGRAGKGRRGADDDGRVRGGVEGQPAGLQQPARLQGRDRSLDQGNDGCRARGGRGDHDPADPSRPSHALGQGRLAACRRAIASS